MKRWATAASMLLLASLPVIARAQNDGGESVLIHLDTPAALERGQWGGRLDLRVFGGSEDLVYTSLAGRYGFGNGWEGVLRASLAGRESFALPGGGAIRHGGSDVELAAKWRPPGQDRWAGVLGVSFPSTPAQDEAKLTLGITAAALAGDRAELIVNPRVVFIEDNTILGLGLGGRVRISDRAAVVADWTPILAGENTRRTSDGSRKRAHVWGIALQFDSTDGTTRFDLGIANGLGSTTGFALTPGLGGTGAFYAAVSVRR